MPFNIFDEKGPSKEGLERTKHVNSDLIICETLTLLVKGPLTVLINSQCIAAYMLKNQSWANVFIYIYSLAVSLFFNEYTTLFLCLNGPFVFNI